MFTEEHDADHDLYRFKTYNANVYWGQKLVNARRHELERAERNLAEYKAWWSRFIRYCHTGK